MGFRTYWDLVGFGTKAVKKTNLDNSKCLICKAVMKYFLAKISSTGSEARDQGEMNKFDIQVYKDETQHTWIIAWEWFGLSHISSW